MHIKNVLWNKRKKNCMTVICLQIYFIQGFLKRNGTIVAKTLMFLPYETVGQKNIKVIESRDYLNL